MSRNILDTKVISTVNAGQLATFVQELTLKGYEPLLLQCSVQWGQTVITMALYDQETKDESTQESTGDKPSTETTDTINGGDGDGETEQPKAEEKPKTRTRTKSTGAGNKVKQPTGSNDESGTNTD